MAKVSYACLHTMEQVFKAWTEKEWIEQWMFPNGNLVRVKVDAREGGTFSFVDQREGKELDHTGEYITIKKPNKLVFTWGVPAESPDMSVVTIDITSVRNGCHLNLTHELEPDWAEFVPQTEQSWTMMIEKMDQVLTKK